MLEQTQQPQRWGGREPRAWQAAALPVVLDALRHRRRAIVHAVMGSGKSVLIAEVCAAGRGTVCVTVPTVALVEQLAATVQERLGEKVGRYYTHAKDLGARVTIVCLPSLPRYVQECGEHGIAPPAVWIADEAHRTEAATVKAAFAAWAPERALGFSATPFRSLDTESLSLWQEVVYTYGPADAVRDGVIVPYRIEHHDGPEMSVDDSCVGWIARAAAQYGPGLCNAASIEDAEAFALRLRQEGIAAQAVHSACTEVWVRSRIDQLREGRLQVLVHVAMLSEGVDLPWLRWLCMRRPVGSRVRFCQEVGRVLRASEGKTHAVLYDPHDLLAVMGLSYAAVLEGGAKRQAAPLDEYLEPREQADAGNASIGTPERLAVAVGLWRSYLRRLHHAAVLAGAVEQRIKSRGWRSADPSPKQLGVVDKAVRGLRSDLTVPPAHRRQLLRISEHLEHLRRGDVSDLYAICFAIRDYRLRGVELWSKMITALEPQQEVDG